MTKVPPADQDNDTSVANNRWLKCMFDEIEFQLRRNKQIELAQEVKLLKRKVTSRGHHF